MIINNIICQITILIIEVSAYTVVPASTVCDPIMHELLKCCSCFSMWHFWLPLYSVCFLLAACLSYTYAPELWKCNFEWLLAYQFPTNAVQINASAWLVDAGKITIPVLKCLKQITMACQCLHPWLCALQLSWLSSPDFRWTISIFFILQSLSATYVNCC